MILLSVLVLALEILFYSLYMKLARKEGKFFRYLILFTLITIFFAFVGANKIYSYLVLIVMMLYGLKYIVKIKVSVYDMLFIMIMLIVKGVIEHITVLIFYDLLKLSIISNTIIFTIIKFLFLYFARNKLNIFYNYMLVKWKNNNFYIRYLFTIFMFSYVIISIITILFY